MNYLERNDVSEDVKMRIERCLHRNGLGDFIHAERKSNHPEDHYLYMVIARKNDGNYSCWTGYNDITNSLNHGHYCLADFAAAKRVLDEHYYNCK